MARAPARLAPRMADYWWTVYQRTWKGSVVSSFVTPLLYVLAMGVLLGGFIQGDPDRLEGATHLPRLRGARACSPPSRCSWSSAS